MLVENQLSPEMMAALSEQELASMRKEAEETEDPLQEPLIYTGAEHSLLRGSTVPGQAFHPNMPRAALASGVSLEQVNEVRRKISGTGESTSGQNPVESFLLLGGKDNYLAKVRLRELTSEDLQDPNPRQTFEVLSLRDYMSGEEVSVEDLDSKIRAALQKKVEEKIESMVEFGPLKKP